TAATAFDTPMTPIEPPFEPPPPPDRTRFRPPEPTDVPPGVPQDVSSYLSYLPGIYQNNAFLSRFLLIFESILGPLDRTVENMHHYFDPFVTPPEAVDWLGTWVGLALDERWPEDRRRELISEAANLYQWRGTRHGLSEFLRLYTGVEPEIIEPTLREVANARSRAFRFTVRITLPTGSRVSRSLIETIIDAEKPAFAACTLELIEG
ncbi:MAG: phage tail protein, partial [Anaerolineaceae bacterium]